MKTKRISKKLWTATLMLVPLMLIGCDKLGGVTKQAEVGAAPPPVGVIDLIAQKKAYMAIMNALGPVKSAFELFDAEFVEQKGDSFGYSRPFDWAKNGGGPLPINKEITSITVNEMGIITATIAPGIFGSVSCGTFTATPSARRKIDEELHWTYGSTCEQIARIHKNANS